MRNGAEPPNFGIKLKVGRDVQLKRADKSELDGFVAELSDGIQKRADAFSQIDLAQEEHSHGALPRECTRIGPARHLLVRGSLESGRNASNLPPIYSFLEKAPFRPARINHDAVRKFAFFPPMLPVGVGWRLPMMLQSRRLMPLLKDSLFRGAWVNLRQYCPPAMAASPSEYVPCSIAVRHDDLRAVRRNHKPGQGLHRLDLKSLVSFHHQFPTAAALSPGSQLKCKARPIAGTDRRIG